MRLFNRRHSTLVLAMFACLAWDLSAAAAPDTDESRRRVALAIRGGASMGAYEAGLTWSATKIRRLTGEKDDDLLGGRSRPIELVSVAGTSAGGINALLSGLAWCAADDDQAGLANSLEDNLFRDVWLTPDVNRLLPPSADSPLYLPDDAALARRDFVDLAAMLRDRWSRPGALRPGCRVPLGVTVTRVIPEELQIDDVVLQNQRFYIPFELRVQDAGNAVFHFDLDDYPQLEDPSMLVMPRSPGAERGTVSAEQVTDAILTTSAFPTAFGRKQLRYCRLEALIVKTDRERAEAATASEDGELVCPEGYVLAEGAFSDGGLFDNLPIGLARKLAEQHRQAGGQPLPVTYVFFDPGRTRFAAPEPEVETACQGDAPPAACSTMPFDFRSEAAVLRGALGTARQYELYRELAGLDWNANLPRLAHQLADLLTEAKRESPCPELVPIFGEELSCAESLRQASRLLVIAYDYGYAPITAPFSVDRLNGSGIASGCRRPPATSPPGIDADCRLDAHRLRALLANALVDVATNVGPEAEELLERINRSRLSILEDRTIHLTSRGAPITGSLLGAFGAFLEYQFREYDYYVGVYDAVTIIAQTNCGLYVSEVDQAAAYGACLDHISEKLYRALDIAEAPRARYVYALAARREFGEQGHLAYAYEPMPEADDGFRIIHEALEQTLQAGYDMTGGMESSASVERTFFDSLRDEGFRPTPQADGSPTLLGLIMQDPEYWSHELIKRWTNRIVKLSSEAEQIYAEREPDPKKREKAATPLMGAGAWVLQTSTYMYPPGAFAPSTAPKSWVWRNVFPYELAFDFTESDLLLLWQPTWNFGRTNLGLRFGFGFAGGLITDSADETRENYGTLGLDFTVLTKSAGLSGWGVTPAVYHSWHTPRGFDQTTAGFDVHVGFWNNRLRAGVGTRDINNAQDAWFLTLSIADLPGAIYWLTR